jgi:hypothetical protein
MTAVDRLLQGAELLDLHELPDVALSVRLLADAARRGSRPQNWRNQRRVLLRRIKLVGHPWEYPSTAARLMSAEWRDFVPTATARVPGSLGDLYQRLADIGAPPLGWRRIFAEIAD